MSTTPCKEKLVLMDNFNTKVGQTTEANHIQNLLGKYGLRDRNARGEHLIHSPQTRDSQSMWKYKSNTRCALLIRSQPIKDRSGHEIKNNQGMF